jgi:hypothetical protein
MRQYFQQIIVMLFAVVFLADALNIDELFEHGAVQREDDLEQTIASENAQGNDDVGLPFSLSFAKDESTSPQRRLEIVDVDSPSLEASYVGADQSASIVHEGESHFILPSAHATISLYRLCRIQV